MYSEDQFIGHIAKIYLDPSVGFMVDTTGQKKENTSLHDIVHYCYHAYYMAATASGPQVIGRAEEEDLKKAREELGKMTGDDTLHTPGAQGNVLSLDKWALLVNDCWLMGGIHRRATFELVSPLIPNNFWNTQNPDPRQQHLTVMAREVIGLFTFDYAVEPTQPGKDQTNYRFIPPASTISADLEDYHLNAALFESKGLSIAGDLIGAIKMLSTETKTGITKAQREAIVAQWKKKK